MSPSKCYVRQSAESGLRVGESDVSLDSIVIAYQQGYTAETIQQLYPPLSLEEVYGAIAYYLANREEVHSYLQAQQRRWQELRDRAAERPSEVVARLRSIAACSSRAMP